MFWIYFLILPWIYVLDFGFWILLPGFDVNLCFGFWTFKTQLGGLSWGEWMGTV